jgi:isopentenyl-diphosphate delta-isomerase type 1
MKTTDNQDELFTVVDASDNVLGFKTRRECHADKNLIHRIVGILIFDKKGRVLLQKRSKTKDLGAGKWGTSAAGHVSRGESYEAAAKRELKEELGIDIPLKFKIKKVISDETESEMSAIFTGVSEGPFYPDPEEVEEVKFFTKNEILAGIKNKSLKLTLSTETELKLIEEFL